MVSSVSSGMILGYIQTHQKHKVTLEEMFKHLSVEMGGDGKTISKKQLDDYIKKAQSGEIKISNAHLSALKQLQAKWNDIAKGKDSISFANMKNFALLLMNLYVSGFQEPEDEKSKEDSKNDVDETIEKEVLQLHDKSSSQSGQSVNESGLKMQLQKVLADKSNDDSNPDLVDKLTNIIAKQQSSSNTTVEIEV